MTNKVVGYIDILNMDAVQQFLTGVGLVAEEAPEMTGYEIRSQLLRLFDDLAAGLEKRAKS